jgi:hypothetical protein
MNFRQTNRLLCNIKTTCTYNITFFQYNNNYLKGQVSFLFVKSHTPVSLMNYKKKNFFFIFIKEENDLFFQ